jgi:hypothetical protein
MPSVSWSRIKLWRRCHKAHHYKYVEKLTRKKRAIPLLRGTIIGEMLDARAMPILKQDPYKILKKYAKQYAEHFREEQEKYGDIPGDIKRLFEGYERKYANEGLEYLGHEEFVALDLVKDIRFIGYIDKRVVDQQGRMFLMDHKTHRIIPNEDQRFSDLQKVMYVWAWNEINSSRKVTGFIWDYIRTKAPTVPELLKDGKRLSMAKNIDTDYWTYLGAIKAHKLDVKPYLEFLAELKKREDTRYIRIPLPNPPKAMIASVVEDMKETAKEIHSSKAQDRNMTRMCPSDCDFYQLCQAEVRGLDAKYVRKAEYEEREPDERTEAEEE